jgi:hypothetical protein
MSRRDSTYERKERDQYNTPDWVTQLLIPHLPDPTHKIWEPACGAGSMVRVLADNGYSVHASDIVDGESFFDAPTTHDCDGIVTNPPYTDCAVFIQHALDVMMPKYGFVCMLLPSDFSYAKSRRNLFADCPIFKKKIEIIRRIVWFERDDGKRPAPSENHAWCIWDWRHRGPPTLAWAP